MTARKGPASFCSSYILVKIWYWLLNLQRRMSEFFMEHRVRLYVVVLCIVTRWHRKWCRRWMSIRWQRRQILKPCVIIATVTLCCRMILLTGNNDSIPLMSLMPLAVDWFWHVICSGLSKSRLPQGPLKCQFAMSGNDFLNKNVLRWRWKVNRDVAEVTSSGSWFHVWGPETETLGCRS